jgi:hypothetical protein
MRLLLLSISWLLGVSSGVNAQCGFDTAFSANKQTLVMGLNTNPQAELLIIPTVVHVIHIGEPLGIGTNISETQILSAIHALNEDFRKEVGTNGFGLGVDTEIEFCLAKRDDLGNPSNGITRSNGSGIPGYLEDGIKSGNIGVGADETEVKASVAWPRESYLNIFVVTEIDGNDAGNGTQGYAYFPFDNVRDGVTVLYNTFGTEGNLKTWTNLNRILTHEVGHYLGLYHTFHNTNSVSACSSEVTCETEGDQVCDTPPTVVNSGCLITPACENAQIENYMDYTAQDCKNTFTAGQSARMRNTLYVQRSSLLNSISCTPISERDIGISEVVYPEPVTCSSFSNPTVRIVNYGTQSVTSFDLQATLDATDSVTVTWLGELESGYSVQLELDSLIVSMGDHVLDLEVNWLSEGQDDWIQNNTESTVFTRENIEQCTVVIEPDYFASETTWSLTGENGDFVMGGGPYDNDDQISIYSRSTCLNDGCYAFTVFDAFGDGLNFGGGYQVLNNNGDIWASGFGNFGESVTHQICAGPVPGCMYSFAANYNPTATYDDGSCYLSGCIDPVACNFLPAATIDDGTCLYASFECAGDLDNDGYRSVSDLLIFLSILGSSCN